MSDWKSLSYIWLFATLWTIYTLPWNSPGQSTRTVAYPFSSRSSSPRNWTGVSWTAGGFFTSWAIRSDQISRSVVSRLFATPWITARQASLSITNSWSSLRLIESVMPSSHLILCLPLLLLPPIPPSIRVFSNESTLRMRWPKYWSFGFNSFLPKKSQGWSPSEWTGWISLQSKGLSRVFSNTTVQKHQFFHAQPSSQSNSHIHTWPQEKP